MSNAIAERDHHDEPPPGVEVFRLPEDYEVEGEWESGWYFWSCQNGCLPDSDPLGPYDDRQDAIDAAWEIEDEANAVDEQNS